MYKGRRWRAVRERVLRRDGYQCQEAKRYGRSVGASVVHHIYPVGTHPELKWERFNLVSLSAEAHNAMHDRATGRLTPLGREWQNRRRGEYLEWCRRHGARPHFDEL